MARPKSEDKKQALLEAATAAFAQSGIAASTALIARNAGVAEGTLFRYFATKDDLLNALYLHLKQDLARPCWRISIAPSPSQKSIPAISGTAMWTGAFVTPGACGYPSDWRQ